MDGTFDATARQNPATTESRWLGGRIPVAGGLQNSARMAKSSPILHRDHFQRIGTWADDPKRHKRHGRVAIHALYTLDDHRVSARDVVNVDGFTQSGGRPDHVLRLAWQFGFTNMRLFAATMTVIVGSWGQKPNGATGPPQSEGTSRAVRPAPPSSGLTGEAVLTMVRAELSENLIVARLWKENKPFDLGADDLVRIKEAHVTDNVLKVMLDPGAEIRQPRPSPAATPVVAAPLLGIPVANPSGATPASGTNGVGNQDNPTNPHDSGVWLYAKDRDGVNRMTVLERAAYQGAKTGGVFTSELTYGIKRAKQNTVIPGQNASTRVHKLSPIFYFYFDDKAAGLGKSYFGIGNLSNPHRFALIRLDVTKSSRETTIAEIGAFGASSGTSTKAMEGFKPERLRNGLYKVTMNRPLQDGEYCFLASSGFGGAYGAGAGGAVDLVDFGVSIE